MLVGRATELAVLDALAADLLAGRGRALVLRGDAGIGKTTLLDAMAERCGGNVTVLRARGVEGEAELAFSALSDLLGPVVHERMALPAPQAAALAGALALGPPQPGDRVTVGVATLGLLMAVARKRGVLVVVDDVQWLDGPSRECLIFAARRAAGPVAFALALREPEGAGPDLEGLPELPLGPVGRESALELLAHAAPDLPAPVARAVADAAAGNPLALVELPATLSPDQRAGLAELAPPLAPGARLQSAFAHRIGELSAAGRRALTVAAIYAGDDLATISAACADAGTDASELFQAEGRGLARIGAGRLAFAHPLIRGAVRRLAPTEELRRGHRALAGTLEGEPRAWHLAAAAIGPDENAAAELERAADSAASRRGYASASAALERAARLSPDTEAVARRLLAAGQAAGAAGAQDRALALLEEAATATSDQALRARAQHLRGRIMVWSGSPGEATRLLIAEAGRAAAHDHVLAATIFADAANGSMNTNSYRRAEALAQRAVELLGDDADPSARAPVLAMLGWVLALRGKAPQARPVLSEAERLAQGVDGVGPDWPWLHLLLRARIPLEELEQARTESVALCERARDAGALATLSGALLVAADVAFRLGDWDAADEESLEAIRVTRDAGQPAWRGVALTTRARLTAARGLEEECRGAALTALGIAESGGYGAGLRYVHGALGFLALGLDRVDEAIAELETVERIVEGSGLEEPTVVPWPADLVEAYVRDGRAEDARRVLAMLERQAASSGSAFAAAAAARCRGMLEDDFEPPFARALAHDDRRPMPFERARTLLALGRRLHRARRRVAARERLREALSSFERLGAEAWAAQARNELRAARAGRRPPRDRSLTSQELRVVAAVRRGASNREIAAELFLSPKTIDFHLRQIYGKLGVQSRSQLVATLARETASQAGKGLGPAAR